MSTQEGLAEASPAGGTLKIWVGVIVSVLVFALFIDWFRMKITPAKKEVDQARVEQLAHDLADEQVAALRAKVEKAEEAARRPGPPADGAAPDLAGRTLPTPAVPQQAVPTTAAVGTPAKPPPTVATAATGPASRPVRNAAYAALFDLKPVRPADAPDTSVTDEQIERSIRKGVDWLAGQFTKSRLKNVEAYGDDWFPGMDAISVYALLTAGRSINDDRVRPGGERVKDILDGLKALPMEARLSTYSRSLRISALGVMNRKEDRGAIESDARWLFESNVQGAFTYGKPPAGTMRSSGAWDNSNSQYGGLGLWAAAETGFHVPNQFWKDAEAHWTESQVKTSGGWCYNGNSGPATLAMTCAGATMLMVARDQLASEGAAYANVLAPLSKPLERAMEWLDEGDHAVEIGGTHYGYTLYGLERIGLASGYKFFGKHDWYRELAKRSVEMQQPDGSWPAGDPGPVETAFHLLFLTRGREPVFMAKLRFDGNWSNRPRDVAALTRFAGKTLERSLNWQVVATQRNWMDWTDAPVLLITSEDAPPLTETDVEKLRDYVEAGGLIFTHAENGNEKFNAFAADLAKRLFPNYPLTPLPATHGIYSAMFPVQSPPPLSGVSNGSRLLMVHSGVDLTREWGARPDPKNRTGRNVAAEMGVNVVVYATGKRDLRRRTDSLYVAARTGQPIGTIPVARLKYDGNWDPEPWGWVRAARKFDRDTSIGLDVRPVDVAALEPRTAPVAHLTGTAARTFTDAEVTAVRQYVQGGGVLLVDACGGSREFAESVRTGLLARAFPQAPASVVEVGHPIMGHRKAWMSEITNLPTRGDTSQSRGLQIISDGKGAVLFTDLDVSTGLLGTTTSGVRGYEPTVAERLVQNLVVWAIWPEGAPPMPESETAKPSGK